MQLKKDKTNITTKEPASTQKDQEFFLKESQYIGAFGFYVLNFKEDRWSSSEILDTIFGIEPDEIKTISFWLSLIHPEQKEEVQNYFLNTVIAGKKQFNKEYRIIRKKDGTERWVWGKGELEFDKDRNPVRMIGTVQDITERKLAESAIKESEENFRTIFQNASDGIFIASRKGNYTDVNDAGLKMLGYEKEELLQLNLRDLIPVEELEFTLKNFSKLQEGLPASGEHHLICKDGELLPVEISATVLPNGSLLGMVRDISERKEAELEKDYLLSFNKRLIENSPIGTLLYKVSTGRCVLANNAAKIAIGAPIEKLLTQNFWEIPSWKGSALLENAVQVIESGKVRKFTAHFTTTFGRNVGSHLFFGE